MQEYNNEIKWQETIFHDPIRERLCSISRAMFRFNHNISWMTRHSYWLPIDQRVEGMKDLLSENFDIVFWNF